MNYKLRSIALNMALAGFALVCAIQALGAEVEGIRLGKEEGKTRLVFDLSGPVDYSLRTLDNPTRVIITIANSSVDTFSPVPLSGTPIDAIDFKAADHGAVNFTINLSRDTDTKAFILAPYLTRGDRLVVDLYEKPIAAKTATPVPVAAEATAPKADPVPAHKPEPPRSASRSQQEVLSKPKPTSSAPRIEFGGTWEQEWAYRTQDTGTQKFESLIEPQLNIRFSSGSELVTIARVRLDASGDLGPSASSPNNYSEFNGPLYNSEHAEVSLREFYFDTEWAGVYWRLGKQQVVWGQADGIKVLDVVNPQSFREFILDDFDDSRIPLWMINAEIPLTTGDLQVLWIPDTSYHELAEPGTPYFLTSPKWIPTIPPDTGVQVEPFDKPDNALQDSDAGLRYSVFAAGWDLTLNYLYHYQDYPVLYRELEEGNYLIQPGYERNHLFGSTLSNAFDSFTLRAELAYSTDTFHTSTSVDNRGIRNSAELASVVGLDWQYSGSGLLSGQWFLSYLPDYSRDIVRDQSENTLSLVLQQGFANDSWQLRVIGLYSLNDEDSLIQLKLNYWLLSNLEVWLGGDIFNGTSRGSFGQFNTQDRLLLGLEYGF